MLEPLELYVQSYESVARTFEALIKDLPRVIADNTGEVTAAILADKESRTAFRYLTAPPISDDDLKTLAGVQISTKALRNDPQLALRVRDVVMRIIDPHRFPWVPGRRQPTNGELRLAVAASSVLVASKVVETSRRHDAKRNQEDLVKSVLRAEGFEQVPTRTVPQPHLAPEAGQFCGESKFGSTRADILVHLRDGRIMPIECKVSNSDVNSYKRVNHEAANKARQWLSDFGRATTVPAAVLSGVYNPANLFEAQRAGLAIFWSHRLEDLAKFVGSAA